MLSSLNCVGRRYCRFSPFASISFASLLEHGNAQNHLSFTNARLCFAQAPWYTSEIHMNINTKTPWRHEEDMYDVDHTQEAKSAPNPAQPAHQSQTPQPPSTPSTAKSHAQPIPARHTQKAKSAPNPAQTPRPTQPSALSTAKSPPNIAQRAHQRVQSLFF